MALPSDLPTPREPEPSAPADRAESSAPLGRAERSVSAQADTAQREQAATASAEALRRARTDDFDEGTPPGPTPACDF